MDIKNIEKLISDGQQLTLLFSSAQIQQRVKELGAEITSEYEGRSPVLIGILNGSFLFMADLVRSIDLAVEIDFIALSSYRQGTEPGIIELRMDTHTNIKGRDVILVDDIFDTGGSLSGAWELIKEKKPASLKVCALVEKKVRQKSKLKADFIGFKLDAGFIVGYGMDLDGIGRNLPDIYEIK